MSEKNISGITKIAVKGFKSIAEECAIDIRPLTILAGANSSGKSSIMQPLLMLKQTLEAPYDPGALKIDGPNVDFTEASQFLSKLIDQKKKKIDCFQISVETMHVESRGTERTISVETIFGQGEVGIEIVEMAIETKSEPDEPPRTTRFVLSPGMSPEEIKSLADQHLTLKAFDVVGRSRCFLRLESQHSRALFNTTAYLESCIFNSIHLPGLRGNPDRIYKLTSTGPRYPGTFEYYAASIIHEWQQTKDKRLKTVTAALHTIGLTGQIGTQKVGDVGIEVQVGRLPHGSSSKTDMVNITDVGLGVSQVLPVLVALIAAEEGQLVYLEQPELHLHPRAQVALARVLADAAKRGVRIVAETHSSLLLLGVQTLVAEGNLSPELVKLHWFSRNKDGVTEVNSVDLDEAGTYGDWPVDFDDVDLTIQSRYLDAVDKLHFGKEETS